MRMTMSAAAVAMLAAGAAGAATVTFDALPDEGAQLTSWSEDGVLVTADGALATYDAAGAAHLDDFGTGFASSLTFSTGGLFAATSFDILPDGTFYDAPFANVAVTGYVGGSVVASDAFDMFAVNGTYTFSGAFSGIDTLVIGFADAPPGLVCDDAPCTHYSIDSVTLAPVPLPASGALLAFGVVGLAAACRRKR